MTQTDLNSPATRAAASNRDAVVKQARIWVAQTFFGTLLKQMHDSPFRSELFSGGRGGQAFSSLLDQHLTQRMAGGNTAAPLVDAIVNKIERAHPSLRSADVDPSHALNATLPATLTTTLTTNLRMPHVATAPRD